MLTYVLGQGARDIGNMTDGHHQNQVEEVRNALQEFLANNPASTVGENSSVNTPCVLNPWGDDSIVFSVTSKDAALIEVINSVTLPERYSAIWHHKTKRLEIIFTAYPLTGALADVIGRSFEFIHKERVYGCSYNSPSDELLLIADSMIPVGPPSSSSYRSMGSFRTFMMSRRKDAEEEIKQYFSTVNPICFWIDGIEWDENEVLDLANHLNFYMFYYDTASPRINIHSPQSENVAKQPQTRYTLGKFPSTISSISIDDNLLHFVTYFNN